MIKHKIPTVTIGIPAYNEEVNIGYLLSQLLRLKQERFRLEKIIVFSDGSTDNTVKIVEKIKNPKIQLIESKIRRGVSFGLNKLCHGSNSNILVILAADMGVPDPNYINNLIFPIIKKEADLTSGLLRALKPKTFFEKILYIGRGYQNKVFHNYKYGNIMQTCYGAGRAFSKRFYKNINFPTSVGEDMYSYLACIQKGYKYRFVKDAVAVYKLPDNFEDHKRQSTRFFSSIRLLVPIFGKKFIEENTHVPMILFLKWWVWAMLRSPIKTLLYALITLVTWMLALFNPGKATKQLWDGVNRSKKISL